jgi:4,5-epoxidase
LVPKVAATFPGHDVARAWLGDYLGVLRYDGRRPMLVRPDAHLAWRGGLDDTAGLERWLAAALQTGRAR